MVNRGENDRERIITAFGRLRDVTRVVKIAPFLYSMLYIMCLVCHIILRDVQDITLRDNIQTIIDESIYVSPVIVFIFYVLSYRLSLCNWYRLQCTLPTLSQVTTIIDAYVYEFPTDGASLIVYISVSIFLLTLINTYFVFIKN